MWIVSQNQPVVTNGQETLKCFRKADTEPSISAVNISNEIVWCQYLLFHFYPRTQASRVM